MADCLGISKNTYTNWKKGFQDQRKGAKHVNNMKYTEEERLQAYCALMLNSDVSPSELVAKCLDEKGIYLGSAKWLYRPLEDVKSNAKRGSSSNKDDSVERRTLTATRPNQVWVWDITYLYKTKTLGEYFYLYAVMDLFSRNMMHREVHNTQSADIAARFIEKAVKKIGFIKPKNEILNTDGVNTDIFGNVLELRSDNGTPMRGSTMVSKCLELGISCIYNRPRHSNDNAHMEASFRQLKHGHEILIPKSFDSLEQARGWVDSYYDWYKNKHRHSGICYITPKDCYDGKGEEQMVNRNMIMEEFYERHSKQKAFAEATGKRKFWKMPEKSVVMPFYSRRSKVKNKIRGQKLDSGEWANVGNGEELKKAG